MKHANPMKLGAKESLSLSTRKQPKPSSTFATQRMWCNVFVMLYVVIWNSVQTLSIFADGDGNI